MTYEEHTGQNVIENNQEWIEKDDRVREVMRSFFKGRKSQGGWDKDRSRDRECSGSRKVMPGLVN